MPDKQASHTNKKLIVVICGFLSQQLAFYFDLGLFPGNLTFITSCGAFFAVQFSDEKVMHGQEKDDGVASESSWNDWL